MRGGSEAKRITSERTRICFGDPALPVHTAVHERKGPYTVHVEPIIVRCQVWCRVAVCGFLVTVMICRVRGGGVG